MESAIEKKQKKNRLKIGILAAALALCFVVSFSLGKYPIDPVTLGKLLLSRVLPIAPTWPSEVETVVFQIRLPRVIMGVLIGAGLSCAGTAYQSMFQNPVVSPDTLGVSSGAGFGAALGIFLSFGYFMISVSAFLFGLAALGLVVLISTFVRGNTTLTLILAGMVVSALFTAAISYLKLIADPTDTLPAITYWLMGSLASIRMSDVLFSAPLILAGIVPILLVRWQLNVLTMGDEEARTMGVSPGRLRGGVIACSTCITATCVSVSGMIGWVGLVIPHLTRIIVGSDCRLTLPASMLLGGTFLLLVDNFARLLATSEIPIGILTSFIGAPCFIILLIKGGKKL